MVDFGRLLGFDWDDGNRRKSVEKPDVSQAEAEQIFFDDSVLVSDDIRQSAGEPRFPALGRTSAGRLLHVTFTLRESGTKIRVISARDMHRKERSHYEKAS